MTTMYYEADAKPELLMSKKIAILGYGSQGHAHALNLHDSGYDVRVGLRNESSSVLKAEEAGLRVLSIADACAEADVIMVLVPDTEQKRTYENRRRVRGDRNKRLQKLRSELTERTFAHLYETGGMRRVHLRGRDNILKRLVVHGAAFNLSLILRKTLGVGKPRRLQGTAVAAIALFMRLFLGLWMGLLGNKRRSARFAAQSRRITVAIPDNSELLGKLQPLSSLSAE